VNTCSHGGGDRANSPYNYITRGKSFEKVGCSVGSACVGAGAAFDESGHSKARGGPIESGRGHIFFFGGLVFL